MKNQTFCIENFCIIDDEAKIISDSFLSIKRRLLTADKAAFCALDRIFVDDVDEIIFASKYGEFERLDKIIDEYEENNEVSPMKFSASVHNYPIGCFNFVKKLNVPYQALTSGDNSIAMGLLKAVISKNKKIAFCYSDFIKGEVKCVSVLISKKKGDLVFDPEIKVDVDEYKEISAFLEGKKDIFNSSFGAIRKI